MDINVIQGPDRLLKVICRLMVYRFFRKFVMR